MKSRRSGDRGWVLSVRIIKSQGRTTEFMDATLSNEESIAETELLGNEFAALVVKARVDTLLSIRNCDCGARSLAIDLAQTPKSKSYVVRLARRFARDKHIHFALVGDPCPACKQPPGERVLHYIEFGARGLVKD